MLVFKSLVSSENSKKQKLITELIYLGKEFFELVSLAVSAINGCEMCVKSHEQSVLANGGTEQRIWDSIRIASIITSLGKVVY